MKKIIAILLALVLASSMFYGCNKDDKDDTKSDVKNEVEDTEEKDVSDDNTNEDTEEPEEVADDEIDEDQYLNTFMDQWFTTLDPSIGSDMYGYGVLLNISEPLIRSDEDENGNIKIVPAGAKEWEVSDDGLTYTFHLRDNVWTDGKEVTSEDYAYGIRRSADPATASEYANLIYMVKNGRAVNAGDMDLDELGVSTPDDKTLVIELENVCPYFLEIVQQRVFYPQREDLVEEYGTSYYADVDTIPICGPFKIDSWIINNELNYVKNEDYWNADNVKLEEIHVKVYQDANTINNALMTGEIDYAGVGDPQWQSRLVDDGNFNKLERNNAWTGYLMVNFTDSSRIANPKIVKAIAAVIDRQEVIDNAYNGIPIPAYSLVPPTIEVLENKFNTEGEGPAKQLQEDIDDPKALFEEGCKELGVEPSELVIRLRGSDNSERGRIAVEAWQQQIESKLGCKVEATNDEWNAFNGRLKSLDYDLAWLAWGADFNDPSNFLEVFYSETNPYNNGYKSEKFDDLIEKAQKETDVQARIELLKEAERVLIYEDAALIPFNHSVANIFRRKYIYGAPDNQFNNMGFQRMYTVGRDN